MDPRPLVGEPLPLDLLNTAWTDDAGTHDLLESGAATREWLDGHGFDGPSGAGARRKLAEAREALRAFLHDSAAREGVNAVLARGAERPVLGADGAGTELDAAPGWRAPWRCAAALVALVEERGPRVRECANPACTLWFLDVSRPGTRRWCSMSACGNRDKALRHGRLRSPV